MTSVFVCDCGCICGVCPKTQDVCDCECHEADNISCTEIVTCVKQVDPTVNVASLAGMHRNTLFKWITQSWLSRDNEDDLGDFFKILGRLRKCKKPVVDYLFVPDNIDVLLSGIKQKVTIERRQTDIPLCNEGCCMQVIVGYLHNGTSRSEVIKPPRLLKTAQSIKKPAAKKPAAEMNPLHKELDKTINKKCGRNI